MEHTFSLNNKLILITEVSSAIGQQVAIECSKLGALLVIQDKDSEVLKRVDLTLEGGPHKQVLCDLETAEGVDIIASSCEKLDGVSFNRNISITSLLKFINPNSLNKAFNSNVLSSALVLQKLVKQKKLNNPSSVVFLSSVSGVYTVHYADSINAMTNGAISAFVKGAALDLAAQGIRVNSVNPSVIETKELLDSSILTDDELDEKRNYFPLKRFGKPIDVAIPIAFLLSNASSWITGVHIPIDGGYTLL